MRKIDHLDYRKQCRGRGWYHNNYYYGKHSRENIHEFCNFRAICESFLHKIWACRTHLLGFGISQIFPAKWSLLLICKSFLPWKFPLYGKQGSVCCWLSTNTYYWHRPDHLSTTTKSEVCMLSWLPEGMGHGRQVDTYIYATIDSSSIRLESAYI